MYVSPFRFIVHYNTSIQYKKITPATYNGQDGGEDGEHGGDNAELRDVETLVTKLQVGGETIAPRPSQLLLPPTYAH